MDTRQTNRIHQLLQDGVKVKRIRMLEGVGNYAIYKIIGNTGVREKRGYAKMKFEKEVSVAIEQVKSDFICLGIGHCGGCKRMFQHPCLLGYDS